MKKGKHMANINDRGLFVMPDTQSDYLMPSRVYDVLKWVGLILMPALATLIGSVGPAWGLPHVDAIVLTVNAIGTFIGVCIGASHVSAMGQPDPDGNSARVTRGE